MTISGILILFRDVYGLSINKYFFVLLAGLSLCLVNKYQLFEVMAFFIPLFAGLPGNYISFIALILLLVKNARNFRIDSIGLGCIAVILGVELLSAFRGYGFSLFNYAKFVASFLFTFLFVLNRDKEFNYSKIVRNFVIGFLIAIIDLIGEMLRHYSLKQFLNILID